jgi:hypothetical protein
MEGEKRKTEEERRKMVQEGKRELAREKLNRDKKLQKEKNLQRVCIQKDSLEKALRSEEARKRAIQENIAHENKLREMRFYLYKMPRLHQDEFMRMVIMERDRMDREDAKRAKKDARDKKQDPIAKQRVEQCARDERIAEENRIRNRAERVRIARERRASAVAREMSTVSSAPPASEDSVDIGFFQDLDSLFATPTKKNIGGVVGDALPLDDLSFTPSSDLTVGDGAIPLSSLDTSPKFCRCRSALCLFCSL